MMPPADMINKLREEAKGTPEDRLTRLEAWKVSVMKILEDLQSKRHQE